MNNNVGGALWRLAIFTVVCLLGLFALLAIFAQLRFDSTASYGALFTNVTGLQQGNFVRIAGVEVGKVTAITVNDDATVRVTFTAEGSAVLTEGTKAVVRYDNLIGGRYLALQEGAGGIATLKPGATIPIGNTAPALDLDALIGGFKPLFRALNPDQVNALSGQLITALQGEGDSIGSFLRQTAALTSTLADRDALIGQVITNLDTVLSSLSANSKQLDTTVASLSELVDGLAKRKSDVGGAISNVDAVAASVADLLSQVRGPFGATTRQLDRTTDIVLADHDYVDNLLTTLPQKYQILARQGLSGDYFNFYICDLQLKLNGKGGQPVYVKIAGQSSGRCAPK